MVGVPTTANVLAFHGGGYLGYFSALMAEHLDRLRAQSTKSGTLADSFDLLAGTSAGSIIAAGLAANIAPSKIVGMMKDNGEAIFPSRRYLKKLPGIFSSRFRSEPLASILKSVLGEARLGDVQRALLIPAFNQSTGKPCLFRSYDPAQAKISLVDAVLASAAAPTYFPRHKIGQDYYVDGGLVANGPALLAAHDLARQFSVPIQDQRIVVIGTTRSPPSPLGGRASWGALSWFMPQPHLLDILMGGQVDLQISLLDDLGPSELIFLDYPLSADDAPKVHLVLADSQARNVLEKAAEDCVSSIDSDNTRKLTITLQNKGAVLACENLSGGRRRPRLVPR